MSRMFEGMNKMGKRSLWLLIAIGLIALLIAFAYPQIKAVHLQSKAGKLITEYVDQAQQDQSEAVEGVFYCIFPTLHPELLEKNDLDQAILWLNEAKSLAPKNVHSSFLLGQAYCLSQEYSQAINELSNFVKYRSGNTLGVAELGFAYLSAYLSQPETNREKMELESARLLLEQTGFDMNNFASVAEKAYKQGKYQDALAWYAMSDSLSSLPESSLLRYALLQLIFQGSSTYPNQIKDGTIMELARELTVEPTSFFDLETGATFHTGTNDNKPVVTLTSNGQHAGILLDVVEANRFCFSILALDKPPQPTQIGVDVDLKNITTIELVNGDDEWVQFDFVLNLDQGFHTLGIRLLNDKYIEGVIDRNAYIGSIKIEVCQRD